jgi:hypothetical protein
MGLNTGTDQLSYAPAVLNNPVVKPQIFNYANGATMAPTSGVQGLAQGMGQAGAALGKGIQQAGQTLGTAIHNMLNPPPPDPNSQLQAFLTSQQALQMLNGSQQQGQNQGQNPGMSGFNGLAQQYQNPQQQAAPNASASSSDDDD